jgi:hypothetical protein
MSDNYTKLDDTISSHEGKAFITVGDDMVELFELSKLSAQLDMIVQTKRMLGHRMTQHKVTGAEGTGSLTMYFMSSTYLNRAIEYLKTGSRKTVTIQCYVEDPASSIGRQEVRLSNVIIKTIPAMMIDDGSEDPITVDSDITFDDIEVMGSFIAPTNYR